MIAQFADFHTYHDANMIVSELFEVRRPIRRRRLPVSTPLYNYPPFHDELMANAYIHRILNAEDNVQELHLYVRLTHNSDETRDELDKARTILEKYNDPNATLNYNYPMMTNEDAGSIRIKTIRPKIEHGGIY